MSSDDIAKGTAWAQAIGHNLGHCRVGLLILTPTNLTQPWVLFEAGAIYKGMNDRFVCTLLVGLKPPLPLPLGLFQATVFSRSDVLKLCNSVGEAIGDPNVARIESWFNKFWPDLEDRAKSVLPTANATPVAMPQHDIANELVLSVRALVRDVAEIRSGLSSEDQKWEIRGAISSGIGNPDEMVPVTKLIQKENKYHWGTGCWTCVTFTDEAYATLSQISLSNLSLQNLRYNFQHGWTAERGQIDADPTPRTRTEGPLTFVYTIGEPLTPNGRNPAPNVTVHSVAHRRGGILLGNSSPTLPIGAA